MEKLLNELKQARQNKNLVKEVTLVMDIQINYGLSVKEINELVK